MDWIVQGFVLLPLAGVGILLIVIGFFSFIASQIVSARIEGRLKVCEFKSSTVNFKTLYL